VTKTNPIRPVDAEARTTVAQILTQARHGALAVLAPDTGAPSVTRVAIGQDLSGQPMTLISSLSAHTTALKADPRCSVLLGEPGEKGDPLTHPRLTLQCRAEFLDRDDPDHAARRAQYLRTQPKALLYIDFADFSFVRLTVSEGFLNAGFGKAYRLGPEDLPPNLPLPEVSEE